MQKQQTADLRLFKQLYSRLNISWSEKPMQTKNPLLHRPQTGMMAKSIAHKIFNSKRYKLSQSKPANKVEKSEHVFTNTGIISLCGRKLSSHCVCKTQPQDNQLIPNFQKYEKNPLFLISNQYKHSRTYSINDLTVEIKQKNIQFSQTGRKNTRSFRAKSAHFSERKSKKQNEMAVFRKTSQNWSPRKLKKQQKFDVNGWEIQIDQNDINYHGFRLQTEL